MKDDCKILASFEQIWNFKVLHFLMAKVKKVNIAVTYDGHILKLDEVKKVLAWTNL